MDTEHPNIPGLVVCRGVLSLRERDEALRHIDAAPWRKDLRRRVQHYGWVYDYRKRTLDPSMFLGPLPEWVGAVIDLLPWQWATTAWDQCIVNEYLPGQGIGEHSDAATFGPAVVTITLCGSATMSFRQRFSHGRAESALDPIVAVPLVAGEALVLTGPARRPWTHEILGNSVASRRVSLTLRTVQR